MIECGLSFEEIGRMTISQATMLREERFYVNPVWTLIAWVAAFLSNGKAKIIPERVKPHAAVAVRVVPEFARELIKLGWTPPSTSDSH